MMSGNGLLELTCREFEDIPAIQTLDDYMHWEEQLKALRSQQGEDHISQAFAMQLAVLFRLHEYDERVGLPLSEMPAPQP